MVTWYLGYYHGYLVPWLLPWLQSGLPVTLVAIRTTGYLGYNQDYHGYNHGFTMLC